MSFEVGARVDTDKNGKGRVAFCGATQFAEGEWVGVILDEPKGKNNGTVQGVAYFTCETNHGLFIRPTQLKLEPNRPQTRSSTAGLKAPTSALKKDSTTRSPITSPKMSPAASKENISKVASPRKPSSTTNLSQMANEKSRTPPKPALAKEPQTKMSRENSNLSSKDSRIPSPLPPEPEKQQTVGDLVKKVEEKQAASIPSTPIHVPPMTFEDTTRIERFKVEVKDLTEKLDTLRIKRKEDQQRIKELEIEAQKVQSLMNVRTKLADENKDLMRQLEEAKKELVEFREWKNIHQEQYNNAGTELEMALIDKEMAEEKVDMLQKDNDYLNEQIEELKTNLDILRNEMATAGSGGAAPVGNSVQMKQLEAHNEKLKQAVIKLRDLHDAANAAKIEAEKQLAEKDDELMQVIEAGEIYKKQAEEAEKRILEYQEQADAALGAEEMVTILTSKNMEMEEIIIKLEADKEELEALHDMDEQLAETQKEIERDLRKDMEGLNGKIRELIQKLLAEEKHNDELMKTIMKFREKTAALNEQIQDRDDQILRFEQALNGQLNEEKTAASLALQHQVNATKMFYETVERLIFGIELEYARKHNGYLKAFLPDNFTKPAGDNDCVLLNVVFPRIVAKAELFPKLVHDKFPPVPGGIRREHITKSHKAEQWGQVAKVSYMCASLSTVCSQFDRRFEWVNKSCAHATAEYFKLDQQDKNKKVRQNSIDEKKDSAIQRMSVESLIRLTTHVDLNVEKAIDSNLQLLKDSRFDENTSLDGLKSTINKLQQSLSVNVGFDGFSYKSYIQMLVKQMTLCMTWIKLSNQRISFSLAPGSENSDVQNFVSKVNTDIELCEQLISRIGKAIPENEFKIQQQTLEEAQAIIIMVERLADLLHDVSTVSSVQVSMNTELDGLDAPRLKEMIHSSVEKSFGSTLLDKTYEPVEKHILGLRSSLSDLLAVFESGNFTEVTENKQIFPPMLERAHLRKQAAAEAEGLRWQLEKKDLEIQELRRGIKSKMDEIGNYRLKLDMAVARESSSGQQVTAKTKILEDKIDQLNLDINKQKIDFEQSQERLLNDLRDLQKENEELKKAKNTMSKMALYQSVQSQAVAAAASGSPSKSTPSTPESAATRAELNLLELSLEESQRNLRAANLEIIRLRSGNGIPGISAGLPDVVCGPETLRATKIDVTLDELWKEAEHLKREELKYSVYIPDLSKPIYVQKEEREKFFQNKERINSRVSAVRARLHRYWAQEYPGIPFPSKFKIERPEEKAPAQIKFNSDAFHKILNRWGTVQ